MPEQSTMMKVDSRIVASGYGVERHTCCPMRTRYPAQGEYGANHARGLDVSSSMVDGWDVAGLGDDPAP